MPSSLAEICEIGRVLVRKRHPFTRELSSDNSLDLATALCRRLRPHDFDVPLLCKSAQPDQSK